MANTLNLIGSTGASGQDAQNTQAAGNQAVDKSTFLKLLVAQIKNQNPLNPADGMEFVEQLTQFSQLEQLMSINQEIQNLGKDAGGTTQETKSEGA